MFSPLCFLQMLKLCSELEMVLSCQEAKRDKLRETKELYVTFKLQCRLGLTKGMSEEGDMLCFLLLFYSELKWLEEKKQALMAANKHVERLQMEKEKLSEHR